MAWNALVNSATGKIFPSLIHEGGGINLAKGQIITAVAGGQEVAFPVAPQADGTILSYDSNELTGLRYIAVPGAVPLAKAQLLSGNAANAPTIVNGTTPSLLKNKRGTWNYVFSKSGKTNGNTPGTATTSTAFTDTYTGTPGTTNYIVTITDSFTGIRNQVTNSIGWGLA